jgi:hypothetical protein
VKLPGRDFDYLPAPRAEVKSEWSSTSFSPIRLHGMKNDNFIFLNFISHIKGRIRLNVFENVVQPERPQMTIQ